MNKLDITFEDYKSLIVCDYDKKKSFEVKEIIKKFFANNINPVKDANNRGTVSNKRI